MATLDNPNTAVDESTVPFLPTALRYGGIAGLALVVYAMLANLLGFSIPTSIGMGILQGVIGIGAIVLIVVLTIKRHRNNELNGFISFQRAFLVGLVALVVASIISTLFNVLYMTVIDPGYVDTAMEKMEEFFANMGMDESLIETQLAATKERFSPATMLTTGLLWGTVINAVIAAIAALIMKKKPTVV